MPDPRCVLFLGILATVQLRELPEGYIPAIGLQIFCGQPASPASHPKARDQDRVRLDERCAGNLNCDRALYDYLPDGAATC